MLYQADFFTDSADLSEVYSDIAIKIHGAIMKAIDTGYAEILHQKEYHPFSVFVVPNDISSDGTSLIIRVSALSNEAKQIIDAFSKKHSLMITGMKEPLKIRNSDIHEPFDLSGYRHSGRKMRLNFLTPAMLKRNGRFTCIPDISGYFYSVVRKYNIFESDDIVFDDFMQAMKEIVYIDFEIKSVRYNVSGNILTGMVGTCDLLLPSDEQKRAVLEKIFLYASFSGVGGKTGMGMGGFAVT